MSVIDRIDRAKFTQLWIQNVGIANMAKTLRIGQTTVRNARKEFGLADRATAPTVHPAETVENIRLLWVAGKSATEIARKFGAGWTRNMVTSIVHRNNMSQAERAASSRCTPKAKRVAKPKAPKPPKVPKPAVERPEGPMLGVPFPRLSPEKTDDVRATRAATGRQAITGMDAVANDNAVPLMERKFGQCAWPVGTPDHPRDQLVCGDGIYQGIDKCSYCVTHAKRAYARDVTQPKPKDTIVRAVRRWAA
jgi:GcrA cell cycle regulator